MPFNQLYPWQEPEQCFMGNNAEYADCKSESYCSIISCNAMDVTTRPDGSFLAVLVLGD